jgi:PAS domain S-box-containing protein
LLFFLTTLPSCRQNRATEGGAIDFLNRACLEISDCPTDEAVGWGWHTKVHPDDAERVGKAWQATVAEGAPYTIEMRLKDVHDQYRSFLTCARPIRNDNGVVVRWLGTAFDITRQKEFQQELQNERALLVTALDQLPVGVVVASAPTGELCLANKKTTAVWRHPM